jgi:FkbM family methyltransferase
MRSLLHQLKQYGPFRFFSFALSEVYSRVWKWAVLKSFSQHGEDLIIDRSLGHKKKGFYVDIGAFDPVRFSNTMRFYRWGWSGINIEPDTEHWKKIAGVRVRDINLNIGIADKKEALTYYVMEPHTLSTFSKKQSLEYEKHGFRLVGQKSVAVWPLADVLREYAKNKSIDFLSIDVEGFELDVLRSNDWKRFRPKVLCVEMSHAAPAIARYIETLGYKLTATTPDNHIYKLVTL